MNARRPTLPWLITLSAAALAVGCGIAWMDSRPHWDDTGVTAASLLLSALLAALCGLPGILAAILVAGPLAIAMAIQGSTIALIVLAFASAGAVIGRLLAQARFTQLDR
mgnify:CR=1 FL=1